MSYGRGCSRAGIDGLQTLESDAQAGRSGLCRVIRSDRRCGRPPLQDFL
jgi:hypothetical protein